MNSKRIIVTGPESSGKTTLAEQLAKALKAPLVPEYAREFFADNPALVHNYSLEDLEEIATKQLTRIEAAQGNQSGPVVCDTGLLVIIVWALDKFNSCPDWIFERWLEQEDEIYLLCRPDLPWEQDPLREDASKSKRRLLFERYEQELKRNNKFYHVITGVGHSRLESALAVLNA